LCENLINDGVDGTNSRRYIGPLPSAGQWVKLEVPARLVGLEGQTINGAVFSLYDGRATWDRLGVRRAIVGGEGQQAFVQMPDAATSEGHLVRSVGELRQGLAASGSASAVNRVVHADALGTVEAVTAGDSSVSLDAALDAWGNLLSAGAKGGAATGAMLAENPALYLGGLGYWNETDLGLQYVRARWLDSATGSWLSVDPVEGEPRYTYVRNAPTMGVDPSGLHYYEAITAIKRLQKDIVRIAKKYGIQPLLLAGVVWNEVDGNGLLPGNQAINRYYLGPYAFMTKNKMQRVSVGITQVTQYSKPHLDPAGSGRIVPGQIPAGSLASKLRWLHQRDQNDIASLEESAKILRGLVIRRNRYHNHPSDLNFREMSIILTEYNGIPKNTPDSTALPSKYGRRFLKWIFSIKAALYGNPHYPKNIWPDTRAQRWYYSPEGQKFMKKYR
jgi:RHS repeat-associated protein